MADEVERDVATNEGAAAAQPPSPPRSTAQAAAPSATSRSTSLVITTSVPIKELLEHATENVQATTHCVREWMKWFSIALMRDTALRQPQTRLAELYAPPHSIDHFREQWELIRAIPTSGTPFELQCLAATLTQLETTTNDTRIQIVSAGFRSLAYDLLTSISVQLRNLLHAPEAPNAASTDKTHAKLRTYADHVHQILVRFDEEMSLPGKYISTLDAIRRLQAHTQHLSQLRARTTPQREFAIALEFTLHVVLHHLDLFHRAQARCPYPNVLLRRSGGFDVPSVLRHVLAYSWTAPLQELNETLKAQRLAKQEAHHWKVAIKSFHAWLIVLCDAMARLREQPDMALQIPALPQEAMDAGLATTDFSSIASVAHLVHFNASYFGLLTKIDTVYDDTPFDVPLSQTEAFSDPWLELWLMEGYKVPEARLGVPEACCSQLLFQYSNGDAFRRHFDEVPRHDVDSIREWMGRTVVLPEHQRNHLEASLTFAHGQNYLTFMAVQLRSVALMLTGTPSREIPSQQSLHLHPWALMERLKRHWCASPRSLRVRDASAIARHLEALYALIPVHIFCTRHLYYLMMCSVGVMPASSAELEHVLKWALLFPGGESSEVSREDAVGYAWMCALNRAPRERQSMRMVPVMPQQWGEIARRAVLTYQPVMAFIAHWARWLLELHSLSSTPEEAVADIMLHESPAHWLNRRCRDPCLQILRQVPAEYQVPVLDVLQTVLAMLSRQVFPIMSRRWRMNENHMLHTLQLQIQVGWAFSDARWEREKVLAQEEAETDAFVPLFQRYLSKTSINSTQVSNLLRIATPSAERMRWSAFRLLLLGDAGPLWRLVELASA